MNYFNPIRRSTFLNNVNFLKITCVCLDRTSVNFTKSDCYLCVISAFDQMYVLMLSYYEIQHGTKLKTSL